MEEDDKRDERKERIIHTRISESLDEEIRKKATGLGLSVSNLVRNILLNTFGLVEDIMADSAHIARSAPQPKEPSLHRKGDRSQASTAGDGAIIGWQEMTLNLNAVCERCNAILSKGSRAAVAVRDGAGPRTITCPRCLEETTNAQHQHEPHE